MVVCGGGGHMKPLSHNRPATAQVDKLGVKGYRINMNEEDRAMMIEFYHKKDGPPIARLVLKSHDAYDFASDVLKKYDILEGINDHG